MSITPTENACVHGPPPDTSLWSTTRGCEEGRRGQLRRPHIILEMSTIHCKPEAPPALVCLSMTNVTFPSSLPSIACTRSSTESRSSAWTMPFCSPELLDTAIIRSPSLMSAWPSATEPKGITPSTSKAPFPIMVIWRPSGIMASWMEKAEFVLCLLSLIVCPLPLSVRGTKTSSCSGAAASVAAAKRPGELRRCWASGRRHLRPAPVAPAAPAKAGGGAPEATRPRPLKQPRARRMAATAQACKARAAGRRASELAISAAKPGG
mmetsp:Transcript_67070/g.143511  ORF Transcript_67070/g.143511 Transcript_67070/m.143511 type:complete len:265 (-) Transcript_67070:24-818(-)